jgi:hypothetical protein
MSEELKKLAIEAIKIKKRIQADTEKLQEIKNQVVEKSKDRKSSYTIKVDDGSIRIIKYKRLMYYKLNQRGFDKLDNDTKNNLLKNKLVKIKFSVNYDGYGEALNKNSVPNNLKELVEKKERKPFSVTVLLSKKEEKALDKLEESINEEEKDETQHEEPTDIRDIIYLFTDDGINELSEQSKLDMSVDDNQLYGSDDYREESENE